MKARPKETITIVTTESHQVLGCSEKYVPGLREVWLCPC